MAPKFSVGEVVIVVTEKYQHFNGEHTIVAVLATGEYNKCRLSGRKLRAAPSKGNYIYLLEEACPSRRMNIEVGFLEPSLRKKHQPGELSFTELMSTLTNGVKA